MQYRSETIRRVDLKKYKYRQAQESDCPELIDYDCCVQVNDAPAIVYLHSLRTSAVLNLRQAVKSVKYQSSTRTSGLETRSRIFGYSPRNHVRNMPCRATSLAIDQPDEHQSLCCAAEEASLHYQRHFPETYSKHAELMQKILPEWSIPNSVFTSGIANHNNPLHYHFDSGNFSRVCSSMFGFRHQASGGHLCCPDIGLRFAIGDCSLILFDGQGLLHGVTPIKKHSPSAFRYTVVYYSLKQMWNCETVTGEIERLRAKRTVVENRKRRAANHEDD